MVRLLPRPMGAPVETYFADKTCILRRGRLVKDRGTGSEKLNCRNWECGVLVPVDRSESHTTGKDDLGIFRDTVPVPMDTRSTALDTAEGHAQPWFFQSHF